jgi:hypothetical protein
MEKVKKFCELNCHTPLSESYRKAIQFYKNGDKNLKPNVLDSILSYSNLSNTEIFRVLNSLEPIFFYLPFLGNS